MDESTNMIKIADYPQLRQLCWNRPAETILEGEDASALYERNWRFVQSLDKDEQELLNTLITTYGGGCLLAH